MYIYKYTHGYKHIFLHIQIYIHRIRIYVYMHICICICILHGLYGRIYVLGSKLCRVSRSFGEWDVPVGSLYRDVNAYIWEFSKIRSTFKGGYREHIRVYSGVWGLYLV